MAQVWLWIGVIGMRKATAVKNMLELPISTTCPASILRKFSQATLFLDTDSASEL